MKNRKCLSIMAMILLAAVTVYSQGKKEIREQGITSVTVLEYFIEEGMDDPVVESIERFNKDGNLVEVQEFKKTGEVRRWEKYGYDEDGNLVEEVFLDEKGRIVTTEKTIYKGSLRTEKRFYNNRGDLFKKKVYKYEYL